MHSVLKRKSTLIKTNYLHTLYIQYKDKIRKYYPLYLQIIHLQSLPFHTFILILNEAME